MTFEQFLMDKHAEDYIGTKDCMVDDFAGWLEQLSVDEFIELGDQFAKEQSKGLVRTLENIIALPNDIACLSVKNFAKKAIQKAEEGKL